MPWARLREVASARPMAANPRDPHQSLLHMNAHDVGGAEPDQDREPSRWPIIDPASVDLAWIEAQRGRAQALRARARVIRARAMAENARASGLLADAIGVYLSRTPAGPRPAGRAARAASRPTQVVRMPAAAVGASARELPKDEAHEPRRWSGCPVLAERVVFDSRDERWVVREVDARTVPGTHGDRCLILENHERVRRLWAYPAGWSRLPDEALLEMGETGV